MMSDRNASRSPSPYGIRGAAAPRRPADVWRGEPEPNAREPYAQGASYAQRDPYAREEAYARRDVYGQSNAYRQSDPYARREPPVRTARPAQPTTRRNGATPRSHAVDTLVLLMMFIAGPLCGILGVFLRSMLWVFLGVEALALAVMWLRRCFMLRGRIVLSCVLLTLMTLALLAAVNLSGGKNRQFQTYGAPGGGGDNGNVVSQETSTPWGSVAGVGLGGLSSNGNAEPEPTANPLPTEIPLGSVGTTLTAGEGSTLPYDGQAAPTAIPVQTESPMSNVLVAAEAVMKSYMQNWQQQGWENMVQYVTPTWRNAQTNPQLQLYWNHGIWLLDGWTMTAQNAKMNADSITFSVLADLSKNTSTGEKVTKRFDGIVLKVDDTWYVDPDSMRTGIVVTETADAMAAANAAAQSVGTGADISVSSSNDAPAAPTTNPNLTLWYNSDGGSFYHLMQKCPSIGASYYGSMSSFTYAELSKSPYDKLQPCKTCGAPGR